MLVTDARMLIRSHADLLTDGRTHREIAAAVRSSSLHRLSRGLYLEAEVWHQASSEEREVLGAVAAHRRMRGGQGVFILSSAAALHGLPLARHRAGRPHIASTTSDGRVRQGSGLSSQHEVEIPPGDIVEVAGIPLTSPARTVADMARCSSRETAIALACAALRHAAGEDVGADADRGLDAMERFRESAVRRLLPGARGVRKARRILDIADGRVQLPGEAISLMYLLDLGFARPRLQVPVAAPSGAEYFVDFGLDDADVWGEFDGRAKYLDPAMRRAGESVEDAVLREKSREDWIRGTTGRRMVRWGWPHLRDAATLGAHLAAFGVAPRRVPRFL